MKRNIFMFKMFDNAARRQKALLCFDALKVSMNTSLMHLRIASLYINGAICSFKAFIFRDKCHAHLNLRVLLTLMKQMQFMEKLKQLE